MDKTIAGEHEQWEYHSLAKAAAIHQQAAETFEQNGLRRLADEEWGKLAVIRRAINSWVETWEFPSKSCVAASKDNPVMRWQKLLQEHASMGPGVAADVAKNLIRSSRSLSDLARQKRWGEAVRSQPPQIDGTLLKTACWKIRKLEGIPELLPGGQPTADQLALVKLEELANSLGVDEEVFQEAKGFMEEQELEEEWERQRA